MRPKQHIIFGLIFSLIIFLIFPKIKLIGFLIIFLSSVLIDVDHYLFYVFKTRDFNLRRSYKWFLRYEEKFKEISKEERKKIPSVLFFLHGFEILAVIILLSIFVSDWFLFVFVGFSFHLFLDVLYLYLKKLRFDKISLIYDYFKFKKMKNNLKSSK